MTDITIVIVSFNTVDLLRDCLRSVYANTGDLQAELLVVDNASADGSPDMVQHEFPNVRLIRNDENLGFAAANNQAIELATGRYVLLLNSDTVVLGEVLPRSVEYLDEHQDVAVLGCRVLNSDRTVQLNTTREPSLMNLILETSGLSRLNWPRFFGHYNMKHWARDTERDVQVVSGCYFMVRRSALEDVGLLDEDFFFFGEETDWCRRFRDAGWRVVIAPVGEIVHFGSASCCSFGHGRDLLLTNAIVRYHRKHVNDCSAVFVFCLLWLFNMSRFVYWTLVPETLGGTRKKERRKFFLNVVRGYRKAWPGRNKRDLSWRDLI